MARLAICPHGEVKACLFQIPWRGSSLWASARSPYDPFRCLPRRVHYGSGNGVPLLAALVASVVVPVGQMFRLDVRVAVTTFAVAEHNEFASPTPIST